MKLLLFDIDGTLIRSSGAGRDAMKLALEDVYGQSGPIAKYNMSGKTDARIVHDLMMAAGLSEKEIDAGLTAVYNQMAVHAEEVYGDHGVMPCVGVHELLEALAAQDDVLLGLVTGNTAQTSPLKLAAGGIAPSLFKVGAYGSDRIDRNQLPALAMERATALTKHPFMGQNTIIIGDTPADILCARAGETTAVVVATGWHSMDTLLPYQPDHLFENFKDTNAVLAALLG